MLSWIDELSSKLTILVESAKVCVMWTHSVSAASRHASSSGGASY